LADIVDSATRSRMMAAIKGKNTKPELLVRKALHAAGFRFRLHDKSLPGRPDIVLKKHKLVILVHGCFWHGHHCSKFKWPKTRQKFWHNKILGNKKRDSGARRSLKRFGWKCVVIWECEITRPTEILKKIELAIST
jgi:DNA mismatch endonuclease (patch repair protein)